MSTYSSRPSRFSAQKIFHSFQSFSSTSDYHTQSTQSMANGIQASDPQALLLRRWQAVLSRMTTRRLSSACLTDLSRQLENAENLLAQDTQEHEMRPQQGGHNDISNSVSGTASVVLSDTTSPRSEKMDAPGVVKVDEEGVQAPEAAHQLLERVTHAAEQLRQRQQDFKHLHDIAIAKTEEAAEKVSELALEVEELEAEIIGDQAEITYLKFKIRMLEMHAVPYIPMHELNALNDRIGRWKLNWEDIENRFSSQVEKGQSGGKSRRSR